MKIHKKLLFLFLICIHFLPVFSATNDFDIKGKYDFRGSNLGEGEKTINGMVVVLDNLPATFTFTPESQIYFHQDTTIANTTKAVAKLGELKISALTGDCRAKDDVIPYDTLKQIIGNPAYLHQLFMQSNSYSSYNNQSNESVISYRDGNTVVKKTVELIAVCHGRRTYVVNLATRYWRGKNPAFVNSDTYKNQLYVGSYIELFLRTTDNYDPNLILSGANKAKLEQNNFRDIFKLSYRCDDYATKRYETTNSDIIGNPYITSDMLTDGICYNVLPGEVVVPTWDFLLEPTVLATSLDPTIDYGQPIAYASVTPKQNYENKSFSVVYSFDSLKNPGSNSFYMSNEKVKVAKINYDLTFTPHSGYIEKGKEYIWFISSLKE